jgi:tRNA-dihydrouridine synthase C
MEENGKTIEVWPGPMEGVASAAFTAAANSLRLVPRWMTPFIRLSTALPGKKTLREFMEPFFEGGVPVTAQLMGTDAALISRCAEACLELGAVGINLNFGCPSRRVVNGGAGGGALRDPKRAAELLARVGEALPGVPLSVKMRTGWESFAEFDELVAGLRATGAAQKFFVHHRTVKEMYRDVPDRVERFRHIGSACGDVPLILNGDVGSAEETREIVKSTGAAGVMCARLWMRDPYLLRRIEGGGVPDPETGRELFYAELVRSGVAGGALIELAKMLFGAGHPRFLKLIGR